MAKQQCGSKTKEMLGFCVAGFMEFIIYYIAISDKQFWLFTSEYALCASFRAEFMEDMNAMNFHR